MPETQPETHPETSPDMHPDLTGVRAVAFTTCPVLAAHLSALHPGIRTCQMTRLAGVGTLPDTDALLLLTHHDPNHPAASPAGNGLVTETVYIGTDLDDADVWARATTLRASRIFLLPDQDAQLVDELKWHSGAAS